MAYTKRTKEEINQEVEDLLEQSLPKIRLYEASPEDRRAFLDFISKQYNYSPRNLAIIQAQREGALFVGSFKFWKDKGYSVNKGEKAIKILTPSKYTTYKGVDGKFHGYKDLDSETRDRVNAKDATIEKKDHVSFRPGSVFDIAQTNAPESDYPKLYPNRPFTPEMENPEQIEQVKDTLKWIAAEEGVPVVSESKSQYKGFNLGAAKGAAISENGVPVEIMMKNKLSSTEYAAVLIHEIAHVKMHNGKHQEASKFWDMHNPDSPEFRNIKEFQAEMTSYVVSQSVGIDTFETAQPYIAGWTQNLKAIDGTDAEQQNAIMKDVQRVSSEMIGTLQNALSRSASQSQTNEKLAAKEQPGLAL